MKRTLFSLLLPALALALSLAPPAMAIGFVNNGTQWLALSAEEKFSYVRGLNDAANFVFIDDSLDAAIAKTGRTKCLVEKKVTTAILADMLTTAYDKEGARYGQLAPLVVYLARVGEFCRDVIVRERAGFGLPPQ